MKMKIGFIVASTLFLIIVLSTPFALAQTWDVCIVNAQATNLVTDETNGRFSFTVISPNAGTTNSITAVNQGTSESYEGSLSIGDTVVVSYSGFVEDDLVYDSESGYLYYQGPADSVTINTVEIPEFPSFLILPLFMIATLMATLFYRRKHTSQS